MRWNLAAQGALRATEGIADMMIAKKKAGMPDKITMINLVWTAMIAVMLTATVSLYQGKSDPTNMNNYQQMSGRYAELSTY
jgi:hypothetical protein